VASSLQEHSESSVLALLIWELNGEKFVGYFKIHETRKFSNV
jgi:hypothetical protein